MRVLLLEDSMERISWFAKRFIGKVVDYAYTADQANEFLLKNTYDIIFLDHDLAEEHYVAMYQPLDTELSGTGVDTAKFIASNKCSPKAQIIIHSLNSVGSQSIFAILDDAGYNVQKVPYLELKKRML